jgi:DNA-binding transcriptional LysR family regulator
MTSAAAALGYTTGAVSQQIAALERELGHALFERVGRGLRLTERGARFLDYAEQILITESEAIAAMEGPWQPGQAQVDIRLGVFGSPAAVALGPALEILRQQAPWIRVRSVELEVDAAAEAVRRASVDLALAVDYSSTPPAAIAGVERTVLVTEPLSIAIAEGGPTPSSPAHLADFSESPWIMAAANSHFGAASRAMCRRAGFEPEVIHEVTDTGACLAMTAAGLGVTPATRMMLQMRPEGLNLIPLEDPDHRNITLFTRPTPTPQPSRQLLTRALREAIANS